MQSADVLFLAFEKLEHFPGGVGVLFPFVMLVPPLTHNEFMQGERFRFGNVERYILVLHGHEMQFLRHDVEVLESQLLLVGFCSGIGEKLERQLAVDEPGKAAFSVDLRNKPPLLENLEQVYRLFYLYPAGYENIGVHRPGCRNLKRILVMVPVKLLTPTADQNHMLEHAGFLQILEDGIQNLKFCAHVMPF